MKNNKIIKLFLLATLFLFLTGCGIKITTTTDSNNKPSRLTTIPPINNETTIDNNNDGTTTSKPTTVTVTKVKVNECGNHTYQVVETLESSTYFTKGSAKYECTNCLNSYTGDLDILDSDRCNHSYGSDTICDICGTEKNAYLYSLFGDDIVMFTKEMTNEHDIDISLYGNDVKVIFVDQEEFPDYESSPYGLIDKDEFYSNYEIASSYNDSYFRMIYGLMAGDLTEQSGIPKSYPKITSGKCVRCTTGVYVLNHDGAYIGYLPNSLTNQSKMIWHYGGYQSMNEICAYLLAFGELPANMNHSSDSDGKRLALSTWGIYGRVNNANFSGNTSKYPYEPALPRISGVYSNGIYYTETDFGHYGGFEVGGITQSEYNDGNKITRGTCRFVFVSDSRIKSIDERYVFYTYNHYNDFQEYLNYDYGFGIIFGNTSAGNPYCASSSSWSYSYDDPTPYPEVLLKTLSELKALK